jgi:hypothetical protein
MHLAHKAQIYIQTKSAQEAVYLNLVGDLARRRIALYGNY